MKDGKRERAAAGRRAEWARLWRGGMTIRDIAARYRMSRQTVYHGLVATLGPLGRREPEDRAEIGKRRRRGQSYAAIAVAVGSTPGAVYQSCRALGLVK